MVNFEIEKSESKSSIQDDQLTRSEDLREAYPPQDPYQCIAQTKEVLVSHINP